VRHDAARPRIDPEELLANAACVRALGESRRRRVARGRHRQQTMVAAIERPPRAAVPLAAWMARVARNLSFNARRAERRRALHEAAAPTRDGVAAPEESVARTEMFRVVVDAVLALTDLPRRRRAAVLRRSGDTEVAAPTRRPGRDGADAAQSVRSRRCANGSTRIRRPPAWRSARRADGRPTRASPAAAGAVAVLGGALMAKQAPRGGGARRVARRRLYVVGQATARIHDPHVETAAACRRRRRACCAEARPDRGDRAVARRFSRG